MQKTVIVGDTISTFDVKVLGVMKDKGPSGHLILAKFSGPVMEKTGGIAHGMSGSPVYIKWQARWCCCLWLGVCRRYDRDDYPY